MIGLRRKHHTLHQQLAQDLPCLRYVAAQQAPPVVQTRPQIFTDPLAVTGSQRVLPIEAAEFELDLVCLALGRLDRRDQGLERSPGG